MSYCEFNYKTDFEALKTFLSEHPVLLFAFFALQIASGVALEKASTTSLTFIQRLMLAVITTTIVYVGKNFIGRQESFTYR